VDDRLIHGFVSVLQADVFADDADAHAMLRRDELADDFLPVAMFATGVSRCKAGRPGRPRVALQHQPALRKWNGQRPFPQ